MAAPDKTDALVNPIGPKRCSIMKAAATITGGSIAALIDPLVRAGVQTAGSGAPEETEPKVGFIPLMDCASVVMISMLDLDKKYGIKIMPSKEASWAGICGKPVSDDLDAAHMPYGLIYGVQLGIDDPGKDMAVLMTLNNNSRAITLSFRLKEAGVKSKASLKTVMARGKREYVFVQAFPTDTYAMWPYYWPAVHGIHPLQDAKTITVSPPQMIMDVQVGNMDGYYVDEPWGARVIADNIGFTAEATQAIWKGHPERVLGTMAKFVQKYPNTTRTLVVAVLKASKSIDASALNRHETIETITVKSYVNIDMGIVLGRMLGHYTNGPGRTRDDPDPMRFYHGGTIDFPYLSDGMWFLTRHKCWGLLKVHPDYLAMAKQVNRVDIFKQAATTIGMPLSRSDMRIAKLINGVMWDAKNPAVYADDFKLKV